MKQPEKSSFLLILFNQDVKASDIEKLASQYHIEQFFDETFYDSNLPLSENTLARYYSLDVSDCNGPELANEIWSNYSNIISKISKYPVQ